MVQDRPADRIAMLREMIRIRVAEEKISQRYGEKEMRCPTHLCIGQEAPPVGVSAVLAPQDLVFSGHRSHGHYLAKGGDMNAMFAELYGRATGCAGGKGGSQHLVDLDCGFMGSAPILASTISVGVGAAWAAKLDGRDEVSVVYFGDGATEEGTFHESLNFAAVLKLPVLFVCENNLYSVHSAMDIRQPNDRPVSALGPAHGVPSECCDGNDVEAVRDLAAQAVARARAGQGPSLIECMTYRWMEHCGPNEDGALGYRTQEEIDSWIARDPIELLWKRMEADADAAALNDLRAEAEAEAEAAIEFARSSAFPAPEEMLKHVLPISQGGPTA